MSRDPASDHAKQLLLDFVRRGRALRDQRREVNADLAEWRKEQKDQGFSPKLVEMVIRWQEECEDKGREIVDEAEALYQTYRDVVDGGGLNLEELFDDARDRALLKIFAPDDQQQVRGPTKKKKAVADALAAAACSARMRGPG